MKRILASLNHLFRALGHLLAGPLGANGAGRALLATWGTVSISHHPSRRLR
jgi:hypothetical protein